MCPCVRVHVCVCLFMCVYTVVWKEARDQSQVLFLAADTLFFKIESLIGTSGSPSRCQQVPGGTVPTLFCSVVNLNSIIQAGRKARKSTYLSGISNTKTDSQLQISCALYCKRPESSDFPLPSFLFLLSWGLLFPDLLYLALQKKKLLLWDPRVSRGTFFTAHGVIHRGNFFQMIFA